jgi:hypothetical protein
LLSVLLVAGCDESSPVESEGPAASPEVQEGGVWEKKPVLNYLLLTSNKAVREDVQAFFRTIDLSEKEQEALMEIAVREQERVIELRATRKGQTPGETQAPAQRHVQRHNARVQSLVSETDARVQQVLGTRYPPFRQWLGTHWQKFSQAAKKARQKQQAAAANAGTAASATTCYVYATQYNGYTDVEVALPDKYVKFANQGLSSPYENPPYTVSITKGEASTGNVKVDEVGPWNVDDNYWSGPGASPSRRRFADLPQCTPEAEAAYFDGYNNGKDQYGRTVANPAGVDLTPTVARRLGLSYAQNAWVTVNYGDLPGGSKDGGSNGRIIVDSNDNNNGSNADHVPPQNWSTGSYGDYYGTGYYYHFAEASSDAVTFRFYLEEAERKTVYAWWTQGSNRTSAAPYIAYNSNGKKLGTIYEDQRANGGQWNGVGTWNFTAGWNEVKVSHWTGAEGAVIADAIKVE